MAVEDKKALEPAANERLCQFEEDTIVGFCAERQGAAKGNMMVRRSELQCWRHDHGNGSSSFGGSRSSEVFDCK